MSGLQYCKYSLSKRVIAQVAQWRTRQQALASATARIEAIRLAKRVRQADQDLRDNEAQITELLKHTPPAAGLTQETCVEPVSAATVLVAWGYPGRIRSEAAFAALASASPLPLVPLSDIGSTVEAITGSTEHSNDILRADTTAI